MQRPVLNDRQNALIKCEQFLIAAWNMSSGINFEALSQLLVKFCKLYGGFIDSTLQAREICELTC